MFKLEQKDEFFLGSIAGILGAIAKYGFNELMQVLNIAKYDNNATSITTVMMAYEKTWAFWIFGFITALIIGAFFGVVIAFTFSYILDTKRKYLKAIGIGTGIWLVNFGIFSRIFHYPPDIKLSLGDISSMLISLIIYALVTVVALNKLGFFKEPNETKVLKRKF